MIWHWFGRAWPGNFWTSWRIMVASWMASTGQHEQWPKKGPKWPRSDKTPLTLTTLTAGISTGWEVHSWWLLTMGGPAAPRLVQHLLRSAKFIDWKIAEEHRYTAYNLCPGTTSCVILAAAPVVLELNSYLVDEVLKTKTPPRLLK